MYLYWKFHHVNPKWIYTAITRATNLKNVYFYDGKLKSDDENEEQMLNKYLGLKIANYVKQYLEHGREITNNYITPDWLKQQFGKTCSDCGDCLRYDIEGYKVISNLTTYSVDNSECHHLNHVVPLCCTCNQRASCWK